MRMGAGTVVGITRLSVGDDTGTVGATLGVGDKTGRRSSDAAQPTTRRAAAATIASDRRVWTLVTPSWWHGRERVGPRMDDAAARRRAAALAGHDDDEPAARGLLTDRSPAVRATALGALARLGAARPADVAAALADADPTVRRRACEVAVGLADVDLRPALADSDPSVVEAGAWALGERGQAAADAVDDLARVTRAHEDSLCREAAVAALGAIGDERGLPAILAATADKPPVRRRAVIALAPFAGPQVDAALERARSDRDWQVRQAAEDLTGNRRDL